MLKDKPHTNIQDIICTTNELCDILGLNKVTLNTKVAKKELPSTLENGGYPLYNCIKAYIKELTQETNYQKNSVLIQRARLIRLQSDKLEIEIDKELGKLVNHADVKILISNILNRFKSKMMTIPYKLASRANPAEREEIEKMARDIIYQALSELADDIEQLGSIDEDN